MSLKYDLTGQKFGRLTVISRATKDELLNKKRYNQVFWKCLCDCGNIKFVSGGHLRDGHTKSCGCLHDENAKLATRKHGMTNTRLHHIWTNMLQRCFNVKNPKYKNYGARGIKVCKEWTEFLNFYNWAVNNGYKKELTIDRINVDGNYCPENCRWVDSIVQMNNRTDNRWITYQGETHTLAEWGRLLGEKGELFKSRIAKGWEITQAFEVPFNSIRNKFRVECEGQKFYTVKECAEYYHVHPSTMRQWLKRISSMPKEWKEKNLRYINE